MGSRSMVANEDLREDSFPGIEQAALDPVDHMVLKLALIHNRLLIDGK